MTSGGQTHPDPRQPGTGPAPGPDADESLDVLDVDFFRRWLSTAAAAVARDAARLDELDSAVGDADHGSNLNRGWAAVLAAVEREAPAAPGPLLTLAGRRLVARVGGASGPLLGTLFRRAGRALGDARTVSRHQLRQALREGAAEVSRLGGAHRGDATMLDALLPAVDALGDSWAAASRAARRGALDTVPLRARKGRASYLGERSVGHQDPGAASVALLFAALRQAARDGDGTPDDAADHAADDAADGRDDEGAEA